MYRVAGGRTPPLLVGPSAPRGPVCQPGTCLGYAEAGRGGITYYQRLLDLCDACMSRVLCVCGEGPRPFLTFGSSMHVFHRPMIIPVGRRGSGSISLFNVTDMLPLNSAVLFAPASTARSSPGALEAVARFPVLPPPALHGQAGASVSQPRSTSDQSGL
ncbi:uncharacterized protein BO72DRAFT_155007 [Aspergillus fijiensis CBS 313.89]|uniref:Uncharacterized protein n=1 Tax=Aspergillus fijiensis CBS 313.89 TaxID=1448319 RepID=A0A8G1RM76_9EURO|nr:uncharacterized protein BO72DRAFT_155007 [Aspergillus fijiensis CBS 313.89]RAK75845.1 hypothetical protein BO72DRAFT_155007 [Aspergillus fijiensis CBS 313.89]